MTSAIGAVSARDAPRSTPGIQPYKSDVHAVNGTNRTASALAERRVRLRTINPKGKARRSGSPDRIRTGAAALRGRCPRPLDDGALGVRNEVHLLGYQDSNLD